MANKVQKKNAAESASSDPCPSCGTSQSQRANATWFAIQALLAPFMNEAGMDLNRLRVVATAARALLTKDPICVQLTEKMIEAHQGMEASSIRTREMGSRIDAALVGMQGHPRGATDAATVEAARKVSAAAVDILDLVKAPDENELCRMLSLHVKKQKQGEKGNYTTVTIVAELLSFDGVLYGGTKKVSKPFTDKVRRVFERAAKKKK